MNQHQQPRGSALSRSLGGFANTVAGICVFLIAPSIERHIRPEIFRYFLESFERDISIWSSWAFVAVVAMCIFFGISSLLQIIIHLILRRAARSPGY